MPVFSTDGGLCVWGESINLMTGFPLHPNGYYVTLLDLGTTLVPLRVMQIRNCVIKDNATGLKLWNITGSWLCSFKSYE